MRRGRNEQAKAQSDRDYEETAATVDRQKALTADEEAELARLWRKLVKLYHPDRFAHEPDKLETYAKLTAAINRAKEEGDIATLRGLNHYTLMLSERGAKLVAEEIARYF